LKKRVVQHTIEQPDDLVVGLGHVQASARDITHLEFALATDDVDVLGVDLLVHCFVPVVHASGHGRFHKKRRGPKSPPSSAPRRDQKRIGSEGGTIVS
jgi:hypothetical protein